MLLYLPAKTTNKVPCFVGLNFTGNVDTTLDTTTFDKDVTFIPFT